MCYGSISYIYAEKIWIFNKQHSEYCNEYYKNIHSQQKLDTSANLKEEYELITEYMNNQFKNNPSITISEFTKIANNYYNDNHLNFKIFKDTWSNFFKKLKKI